MGVTKTDHYSEEQLQLAYLFRVLGHPARVTILMKLLGEECCICKDFSEEIPLSQPTLSRHLRELRDAGLILGTVEGNTRSYCVNRAKLLELGGLLERWIPTKGC